MRRRAICIQATLVQSRKEGICLLFATEQALGSQAPRRPANDALRHPTNDIHADEVGPDDLELCEGREIEYCGIKRLGDSRVARSRAQTNPEHADKLGHYPAQH